MAESVQAQIEQLKHSIEGLEAQRSLLGEAVINPAMAALKQQLAALEEQAKKQAAPTDERRLVTILFIDMVGSTSMAEKLDPEEWRKIVAQLHSRLGAAINAHHGTVAQYLGDGILALFGATQASELDPENAIRAALEAHTAVADLNSPEKLQIRAGIHTGLVVVGELGDSLHKEFTASGDAMNLAARLQSAAPAGGTLISNDTYRYVRGVFDMTPQPSLSVKGKTEAVQTYLVRRAKPRPFRSTARGVAGVETRTIGREAEIKALKAAYLQAYEGHGVVWAQISADPGMGKSRLLVEMIDWLDLREENFRLLRARAFPDDVNQPFAFIRRMWFDRFQIAEDSSLQSAETKWVERFMEFCGLDECEEAAHSLGLLVSLPFENSPHIKGMRNDPNQVKGRALVVSREVINAVRQKNPLVVLLEDLQWADQASWEYLMEVFLSDAVEEQPNGIFILGTARPEWQPPEKLRQLFQPSPLKDDDSKQKGLLINLVALSDQSTRELALELFQRVEDIPELVIDLLVDRSEGIPYFIEEIVNWLIDHNILDKNSEPWQFFPEKLKTQPLPATLQHLLLTRLSSLSQPEKDALQRGAIFGRRFWAGGVEALGTSDPSETLSHLQPRGFVEVQPESAFEGDTEWSFHHNLLHEVTYESVLLRERSALHKIAATWLEKQARLAGRLDEFAGLLADHYERAGELSSAADWHLRAGMRAMKQGAPREAKDFFTQSLALIPPVDKERRWQALLGRLGAYSTLGEAEHWREDVIDLVELARTFEDENYLAEAYLQQAIYGARATDEAMSEQALQEGLAVAQRCQNEAIEAKLLALYAAQLVTLPDIPGTIEHIDEAIRRARLLGDDDVLAFVLFRGAFCYAELGDHSKAYPLQLEQIELDHRLGNRNQEAIGSTNLVAGYLMVGQHKQARMYAEQAIQICRALGSHRSLAYALMFLGEVYSANQDYRNAYRLFEEALQEITPSQDARGKAFILLSMGRTLLAMGDASSAARRFKDTYDLVISHGKFGLALANEALIYLAACAVMNGQLDEARKYILEGWDYLKANGAIGLSQPGKAYLSAAETFDALGDDENMRAVLESGHQVIMNMLEKVDIPEWRKSFMENMPGRRRFMEMWERSRQ